MITHWVAEITTSEFRFRCFPKCSMSAFILAPGSALCVSYPLMEFALLVFSTVSKEALMDCGHI